MAPYRKKTYRQKSPRTPRQLVKALACSQLHQGTRHAKNINEIRDHLTSDLDSTAIALLEFQASALAEISHNFLRQLLEEGSARPKTNADYVGYCGALTTTLRALKSFKQGSVTTGSKRTAADIVLELSANEPED